MRYESIGALRGFAATAVVVHHVFYYTSSRPGFSGDATFELGACGVDLFFIISGFVMVVSVSRNNGLSASGEFLLRRAIRILPLYWIATLVLGLVFLLAPQWFKGFSTDFLSITKSLCFFPVYDGDGRLRPVISQGWTLYFEWYFYLLLALAIAFSARFRLWAVAASMIALLALQNLRGVQSFESVTGSPLVCEFLLGCTLGSVVNKLHRYPAVWFWYGAIAGTCVLVLAATPSAIGFDRVSLWGVPSLLITAAFLRSEAVVRRIGGEFIKFLGEASYAVYLFHGLSFSITWKMLMFVLPSAPPVVFYLALCAGGIAAGAAAHLVIERPLLKTLRTTVDSFFVGQNAHA